MLRVRPDPRPPEEVRLRPPRASSSRSCIVAVLERRRAQGLRRGATGAGAGSPAPAARPWTRPTTCQAQSALSTAMQNVRDGAISNGAVSASDLGQYGVTTGALDLGLGRVRAPWRPPATGAGADGALGFGSVTLAAEAESGTCWYVWFSTSATWFGFEPDATSCRRRPWPRHPTPGAGFAGDDRLAAGIVPRHGVTAPGTAHALRLGAAPRERTPRRPTPFTMAPARAEQHRMARLELRPPSRPIRSDTMSQPTCSHLDQITDPDPSSPGCEDCLAAGRQGLGAPACMPDLRPRRVAATAHPARHATAHSGRDASRGPVLRAGRGLVLVLRGRRRLRAGRQAPGPARTGDHDRAVRHPGLALHGPIGLAPASLGSSAFRRQRPIRTAGRARWHRHARPSVRLPRRSASRASTWSARSARRRRVMALNGSTLRHLARLRRRGHRRALQRRRRHAADRDRSTRPSTSSRSTRRGIEDWFALAWLVLDDVLASLRPATEATTIQLWPEHFDAATTVTLGRRRSPSTWVSHPATASRANPMSMWARGARPGPATRRFWNVPFGAMRRRSEVLAAPDPAAFCRQFLTDGLRLATSS